MYPKTSPKVAILSHVPRGGYFRPTGTLLIEVVLISMLDGGPQTPDT